MNLPPKKPSVPTAIARAHSIQDQAALERQKAAQLREEAHQHWTTLEATARDTEIVMGAVLFWRRSK